MYFCLRFLIQGILSYIGSVVVSDAQNEEKTKEVLPVTGGGDAGTSSTNAAAAASAPANKSAPLSTRVASLEGSSMRPVQGFIKVVRQGKLHFLPVKITRGPRGMILTPTSGECDDSVLSPIQMPEKYRNIPKFGTGLTEPCCALNEKDLASALARTPLKKEDVADFERMFPESAQSISGNVLLQSGKQQPVFQTPHSSFFDYLPWSKAEERIVRKCYNVQECRVMVDKLSLSKKSVNLKTVLLAQLYCGFEPDSSSSSESEDSEVEENVDDAAVFDTTLDCSEIFVGDDTDEHLDNHCDNSQSDVYEEDQESAEILDSNRKTKQADCPTTPVLEDHPYCIHSERILHHSPSEVVPGKEHSSEEHEINKTTREVRSPNEISAPSGESSVPSTSDSNEVAAEHKETNKDIQDSFSVGEEDSEEKETAPSDMNKTLEEIEPNTDCKTKQDQLESKTDVGSDFLSEMLRCSESDGKRPFLDSTSDTVDLDHPMNDDEEQYDANTVTPIVIAPISDAESEEDDNEAANNLPETHSDVHTWNAEGFHLPNENIVGEINVDTEGAESAADAENETLWPLMAEVKQEPEWGGDEGPETQRSWKSQKGKRRRSSANEDENAFVIIMPVEYRHFSTFHTYSRLPPGVAYANARRRPRGPESDAESAARVRTRPTGRKRKQPEPPSSSSGEKRIFTHCPKQQQVVFVKMATDQNSVPSNGSASSGLVFALPIAQHLGMTNPSTGNNSTVKASDVNADSSLNSNSSSSKPDSQQKISISTKAVSSNSDFTENTRKPESQPSADNSQNSQSGTEVPVEVENICSSSQEFLAGEPKSIPASKTSEQLEQPVFQESHTKPSAEVEVSSGTPRSILNPRSKTGKLSSPVRDSSKSPGPLLKTPTRKRPASSAADLDTSSSPKVSSSNPNSLLNSPTTRSRQKRPSGGSSSASSSPRVSSSHPSSLLNSPSRTKPVSSPSRFVSILPKSLDSPQNDASGSPFLSPDANPTLFTYKEGSKMKLREVKLHVPDFLSLRAKRQKEAANSQQERQKHANVRAKVIFQPVTRTPGTSAVSNSNQEQQKSALKSKETIATNPIQLRQKPAALKRILVQSGNGSSMGKELNYGGSPKAASPEKRITLVRAGNKKLVVLETEKDKEVKPVSKEDRIKKLKDKLKMQEQELEKIRRDREETQTLLNMYQSDL